MSTASSAHAPRPLPHALPAPGRHRTRCLWRHARGVLLAICLPGCAVPVVSGAQGVPAAAAASEPGGGAPRRGERFQNNYLEFEPKGLGAVLRWKLDALRDGLPKDPTEAVPSVAPDLAFITANATAGAAMVPAVTWIGHASTLLQAGGLNLLTDPVFSERVSPLSFIGPKRFQPPGLAPAQLPRIDVVLISHNHYDHLDVESVRALSRQAGGPPRFVVPLGLKAWFADLDITSVDELDWWQSTEVGGVRIVLTPAQHWSGRGLGDRMKTLWGSYAILAPGFKTFFSGDTGYSKDFADIRARLGDFDLALIAVGAYEPRWFMTTQHVNPEEAVQMHRDLGARRSVGIHWGTFSLTDESFDEPPRALAKARAAAGLADDAFTTLAIGQTLKLSARRN